MVTNRHILNIYIYIYIYYIYEYLKYKWWYDISCINSWFDKKVKRIAVITFSLGAIIVLPISPIGTPGGFFSRSLITPNTSAWLLQVLFPGGNTRIGNLQCLTQRTYGAESFVLLVKNITDTTTTLIKYDAMISKMIKVMVIFHYTYI